MSVRSGQTRTFRRLRIMSALPPKSGNRGSQSPIPLEAGCSWKKRRRSTPSLHDQNFTRRQLHQTIRGATDQAVVERRMSHEADDEKIKFLSLHELDDTGHGVTRNYMRFQLHMRRLCLFAGSQDDLVEHLFRFGLLLDNLIDRRWKSWQFFNTNHVER